MSYQGMRGEMPGGPSGDDCFQTLSITSLAEAGDGRVVAANLTL